MKTKKQNTLKPKDISYEPIIEEKKPYYLHSVERYRTGTPIWHYIAMAIILLIIFSLAIILG